MIRKLDVNGLHIAVGDDLAGYVRRKIGRLDRFAPRRSRDSLRAEVKLKQSKAKKPAEHTCEVQLHMTGEVLTVKETTINIYAAVDIAEAKLAAQLRAYKQRRAPASFRRKLLTKIKRTPTKQ